MTYDPTDYFLDDILRKERPREKLYQFDRVYGEEASQRDVFESVECQVDAVLNGFNATVFCYGATGAGKTHTMMGTNDNPGLMVLTLKSLFQKIECLKEKGKYKISISYLEIYNEKIRDLLTGKSDFLELQEDQNKGVIVSGITYMSASDSKTILSLLRKGNRNRIQEATGANEKSSRSHAILQVYVTFKSNDNKTRFSKLSLIDLAGSERAIQTNNRGARMLEGANINRSLLALGNCINSLVDNGKKEGYVNYRDSKLTRLLKDSLGGNCRTVMIANISPSSANFEETLNTLKYASRARNIKTKISQQLSESYLTALQEFKEDFGSEESLEKDYSSKQLSAQTLTGSKDAELMEKLHSLFCKQIQVRTIQLDNEEKESSIARAIQKLQFELFQLENQQRLFKDSKQFPNPETKILEVQQRMDVLQEQKKNTMEIQNKLIAENLELEKDIEFIEKSLPKSDIFSLYIKSEVKAHKLELKNLGLEIQNAIQKNFKLQKEEQIKRCNDILELYQRLTNTQREFVQKSTMKPPESITLLETKLFELLEKHNQHSLEITALVPQKPQSKPSTLSKIRSALGLDRFNKTKESKLSVSDITLNRAPSLVSVKDNQEHLLLLDSKIEKTDSEKTVGLPPIYPSKAELQRESSVTSIVRKSKEKQLLSKMSRPTIVQRPRKPTKS